VSRKSGCVPSVSVVVVNFNGGDYFRRCLEALSKTAYPNFEVIVVDNASTDGSVDEVKRCFASDPRVRVVVNSVNVGHAEGCNIGARVSSGEYLVFLDSDTEVRGENWLRELVKVMESDGSVGLAQAKIVLAEDERRLDYVCVAVDALGTWAANYGARQDQIKENLEVLAASSGCCIVRREVFEYVGGFDADYFIYDDDTDLSLRIRLAGYRVLLVPSALSVHRGGVMRGVTGDTLFHSSKNRLRTVIKNYELRNVWWRFSVLLFFTCVAAAGFAVLSRLDEAKATLKGVASVVVDFKRLWVKRLVFQSRRRVRDFELVQGGFVRNDFQSTIQDFRLKLRYMQ